MEPHPKSNPPKVVRCPHCGNNTIHVCTHREDFVEAIDETVKGDPIWDDRWWAILKCTTCSKLSLYKDEWDEEQKKWIASLAYPTPLSAPREVPSRIREAFDEATSVLPRSLSLAAVGIRRCLEGICNDKNAQGRTLAHQIQYLGSNGLIPKTLIDMMDTSRELGNIGAHFEQVSVTPDEVRTLIEFTVAIFEYIYVAPAKIEAVRKSLKRRSAA